VSEEAEESEESEDRKKRCMCGGDLNYRNNDNKVILICEDCDRHYPLNGPLVGREMKLKETDLSILRHIAFVAYCNPMELQQHLNGKVAYSTIVRRAMQLAKVGYIHIRKRNNHRLFYFRTERLEELAKEKNWFEHKGR
jgi:hypothetical protein